MAGIFWRGRMFNAVLSVVTWSVQVCLMEQATKSSHQALLDSPQRLALVFISSPPCLAFHLLICCLGALHCGKRRGIWIEISYFVLERPNNPFSFPVRLFSHIVPAILCHLPRSSIPPASETYSSFALLSSVWQISSSPLCLSSSSHFCEKKEKESALANTKSQKFYPGLL